MTSSIFTPAAFNQYHQTCFAPSTTPSLHTIYNQGLSDSCYPNVPSSTSMITAVASPTGMEVEEEGEEEGEEVEEEVLEMSEYWVQCLSKTWGHKQKQGKKK